MTRSTINSKFWKDKKVYITGHTGFKGSWLGIWLHMLGAKVSGYALTPSTNPSMFELCEIGKFVKSEISDIRDEAKLLQSIKKEAPEIVFHMAAQPIVRDSYRIPAETYAVNVMGTVNVFEAVRNCNSVKALINVTSDKCYKNKEWHWGYRENDELGGRDPYSSSKAAAELVFAAYMSSFFRERAAFGAASVRAGNVIGGGDWAQDRIVPDCIRSLINNQPISLRYPDATRPWQHVLEPLSGYLLTAERLYQDPALYSESWNFGPDDDSICTVRELVERIKGEWGENRSVIITQEKKTVHEEKMLHLNCDKARRILRWSPQWDLERAVAETVSWYRTVSDGKSALEITRRQIQMYSGSAS
ncbi:MAG TPA: CDP-glucose 4,6-dehydratase [Nitrospirota bacterium]|nr:CDP-glucose 4,6-dehydratase [Nitrospirota bacterium]